MKPALIILLILMTAVPVVAQSDAILRGSQTINGTLASEHDEIRYTYQGEVGQMLHIHLNSLKFDPFVELLDAEGNIIMSNDDSIRTLNSYVYAYLWDDSHYTIVVKSTSGFGDYELEIEAIPLQRIEYSQFVKSIITPDNETVFYYFEGVKDEVISLTPQVDANIPFFFLTILDPHFERLVSGNDDTSRGMIGPYTLPYTGFYVIQVRGDGLSWEQPFLIRLERHTLEPITFDGIAQGTFTEENQSHFYYFYGRRTDVISAYVASDIDTNLTLLNGDNGNQILFNEDSGTGFAPEILNWWLTGERFYYLIVRPTIPGSTGIFSLILEHDSVPSLLNNGTQQVILNGYPRNEWLLTFEPPAPGTYTFTLELAPEILRPSFRVRLTQNGDDIAITDSNHLTETGKITLEFSVTDTAPMEIEFDNLGGRLLVMDVSIRTNSQ